MSKVWKDRRTGSGTTIDMRIESLFASCPLACDNQCPYQDEKRQHLQGRSDRAPPFKLVQLGCQDGLVIRGMAQTQHHGSCLRRSQEVADAGKRGNGERYQKPRWLLLDVSDNGRDEGEQCSADGPDRIDHQPVAQVIATRK